MPGTNEAIDLNVGATFPGEPIVTAFLNYATKYRETMSQDNRDRWDHYLYVQAKGFNNFMVGTVKWPGEIIP